MKKRISRSHPAVIAAASLAVIAGGCSKASTPAASSLAPVTVGGTFASVKSGSGRIVYKNSSHRVTADEQFRALIGGGIGSSAIIAFTSYSLHCATADVPPIESDGTINSDGTFSIDISGGLNKGLTCNVLDSGGDSVAQIIVSDPAKKDMNGNAQVNGTPAFSTNTALGSLILDLTTGEVSVPAANVADSLVSGDAALAGATPFDPTGTWTIHDVDFTLPKGVKGTCPAGTHDDSCNGPPLGMPLYINRLQGVNVSDSSTVYGMQVWQDEQGGNPQSAYQACGSMTGLSPSEATQAGVDLSSYGIHDGAFTFTTTITDPNTHTSATISAGYKASTATAQYDMQACVPKTITHSGTDYNLYVCGPDTAANGSPGGRYSAGLGGGCVITATGATIANMDWSHVTWGGGSCTSEASTLPGFYKSSCPATYDGTPITCTNENGVFDDVNLTTPSTASGGGFGPAFNYAGVPTLMHSGEHCDGSDMGSTLGSNALMQARCYADYYEQHLRGATGCLPRVDLDWSSTSAATFARTDFRPQSLVFMDKLTYTGPNSASMLTRQEQNRGVQVKTATGSQWINCGAIEKGGIYLTKVSDTRLLATYIAATTTTSTDKPACVAAPWNGTQDKFFFYLDK